VRRRSKCKNKPQIVSSPNPINVEREALYNLLQCYIKVAINGTAFPINGGKLTP
jgi:hypothetical protein